MYHTLWPYDVWFLKYGAQQTEYFVILGLFLPFNLPNNQEDQNFKKMEKTPGDMIILHECTKIIIICYTVPEIWHMTDVIFIFHFWARDIIILHMYTKNYDHMMYGSWDMVHVTQTDIQMDGKSDI